MLLQSSVQEIRHFHAFCGLGGGAAGFNRAEVRIGSMQARFRCIGGVDVDAAAIRDFGKLAGVPGTVMDLFDRDQYAAFHGKEPPRGWRESTVDDMRRAAANESPNIVFLSAPCLPADGLVLTEAGSRPISSIQAGERVLTHRGRLREVTHVGTHRYTGTMYGFRLNGTVDRQWFTAEHPLWMRRVVRNTGTGRKRALGPAGFMAAHHVRRGDRIGFPVEQARPGAAVDFIASLGNPQEVTKGGQAVGRYAKPEHVAVLDRVRDLTVFATDPDLWFLIGAYIGDGYRRQTNRAEVAFCVGAANGALAERVQRALNRLGLANSDDADGGATNIKIRTTGRHLHMICGAFGDGAAAKRLPEAIMGLEDELLAALVDGYRATDGSDQARRQMPKGNTLQARWKIPSVSLQLLRDFQRLLLRQGVFASIHKCWPGGPQTIMGREVQTLPRWELNTSMDPVKRTCFEFSDGAVWIRVRDVETREADEWVWNLSVAEDDTFCAPMMGTHNCKGFSGLLPETSSKAPKYQALNRLTLRGVWLMLEAWKDDPADLFIFENVPRIMNRGRKLLDQIAKLFRLYGYATAETTHDCGELGGLAQSRKRFLLVARHIQKVPAYLYQAPKRKLRAVGEVLDKMPLPGLLDAGPMHRVPSLQWKTWVRLAFVEAGGDWRSLAKLAVEDGMLRDFRLVDDQAMRAGVLGVHDWSDTMGTVAGRSSPTNGAFSVADPRREAGLAEYGQYGVKRWDEVGQAVTSKAAAGSGTHSVADPRNGNAGKFNNCYRVTRWEGPSPTVTGGTGPSAGGLTVADPRAPEGRYVSKYRVTKHTEAAGTVIAASGTFDGACAVADPRPTWGPNAHTSKLAITPYDKPARTVTGADRVGSGSLCVADPRPPQNMRGDYFGVRQWGESTGAVTAEGRVQNGAFAVADPRPTFKRLGDHYQSSGHYGVLGWSETAGAVASSSQHDNGRWSVADPRPEAMPAPEDRMVAVIKSLDGTWHRPFTTLELAALQGLVDVDGLEEHGSIFMLDGVSDTRWREGIGNAVPPPAAQAIAETMGRTLLLARAGETFQLSNTPIWVRPVAVALSVVQQIIDEV